MSSMTDNQRRATLQGAGDRNTQPPFPTHPFAGTSKERAEVGLPGHCELCAEVGHVKAHRNLGCGDVGCSSAHDDTEQ
ncbi:hypothetical protein [Streptomyces nigrescens]|uniref:hypothetical protein n=1 Tax=Streptomyces nigrescens TaxID=1920 RepID=UPI003683D94B